MGIDDVLNAISTVGFPIVVCIYFIWNANKQQTKEDKRIEKEEKRNDQFTTLLYDHQSALKELSALNRAELENQDAMGSALKDLRETLIRVESRPCQTLDMKKRK